LGSFTALLRREPVLSLLVGDIAATEDCAHTLAAKTIGMSQHGGNPYRSRRFDNKTDMAMDQSHRPQDLFVVDQNAIVEHSM
jgi:hypothetical protein